jgi:hypothetical protein
VSLIFEKTNLKSFGPRCVCFSFVRHNSVALPKELNFKSNARYHTWIYWKVSEQRIKTAELKNSLLVEQTTFFKKAHITINTSTSKCT